MPLLLLDLDNTVLDRAGPFRAWGKHFLAEIGAPPEDIDWLLDMDVGPRQGAGLEAAMELENRNQVLSHASDDAAARRQKWSQ